MKGRGLGRIYQPTYKDKTTGERKQSATWFVQFGAHGRNVRESSGSTHRPDAVKLLKRRLSEVGRGQLTGQNVERTTFEDLKELLLTDYRVNGKKSLDRMALAAEHLKGPFALRRALDITPARIAAYIDARQVEGAANATINRELAALRRMFRLGLRAGCVAQVPMFSLLTENNTRKGFFEPEQLRAVLAHLPEHLRGVVEVAYITGWRTTSELLTRTWSHVDFAGGWLRLEPGETKNKQGRMFPLTPTLRAVLERQRAFTTETERAKSRIIPWVFHHAGGKPIKGFYDAWRAACRAAGCPGRIQHDFRRTAVRNLERAGVPRSAGMAMVGHLTDSIYRRYAIVDEAMLKDAAVLLGLLDDATEKKRLAAGEQGK